MDTGLPGGSSLLPHKYTIPESCLTLAVSWQSIKLHYLSCTTPASAWSLSGVEVVRSISLELIDLAVPSGTGRKGLGVDWAQVPGCLSSSLKTQIDVCTRSFVVSPRAWGNIHSVTHSIYLMNE